MKSVFENVPDKIIFRLVKMLMEEVDFSELETSQDLKLTEAINSVESYFGIRGEDSIIDSDYIYNLWKLNVDLFEDEKFTTQLNKPSLKEVSFNWESWETQWVKNINEHHIKTYSLTKDEISDYIHALENDGTISWWDGQEIDSEVIESETTDSSIDEDSLTIL